MGRQCLRFRGSSASGLRIMDSRICLRVLPTPLHRDVHHPAHLACCVTASVITATKRGRNVYLLAIAYAFRPRLRSRLTLGGSTFPRNPWASGEHDSHMFRATHAGILASVRSTKPHDSTSPHTERSPTTKIFRSRSEASAASLAPHIFGAATLDQ